MTKLLSLITISVALLACSRAESKVAPPAEAKVVAPAPIAPTPVAVALPAPPVVPSTPRGAILFAATNPDRVGEVRKGQGSVVVEYDKRGEMKVVAGSCDDDAVWAAEVVRLANMFGDNPNCHDNVCINYADVDNRVVFAFRTDGSLAGVIENAETSDAAGTDDDVQELMDVLVGACPETDEAMDIRFQMAIERMGITP
jgi:hypothetical protein